MKKLIQLDGGEGGGQMLRTALSLAMITGQPFRMTNIRGKRSKPGLMRQHLTCVRAACEISGGTADGAEMGSTELVFRAGEIRGGSYQFAIGTAGSTGLLFQTLLPALLHADGPSELILEGGTHNPMAPPFEFLDRVFLPALRKAGADVNLTLNETGFAPAGGGKITATIQPCERLVPITMMDRGADREGSITIVSRRLNGGIPERVLTTAQATLGWEVGTFETRDSGPGSGVCALIEQHSEHGTELSSAFGEIGVTAERVGHRAAKAMKDFLGSGAAVGRYLADQLLLPMALAGKGEFLTMSPDAHVPTNISVIEKFLPVSFRMDDAPRGLKHIRL